MSDHYSGICKQGNLVICDMYCMHRHERGVDEAKVLQSLDRAFAVFVELILDLLRRFVQVDLNSRIQLIGEHP